MDIYVVDFFVSKIDKFHPFGEMGFLKPNYSIRARGDSLKGFPFEWVCIPGSYPMVVDLKPQSNLYLDQELFPVTPMPYPVVTIFIDGRTSGILHPQTISDDMIWALKASPWHHEKGEVWVELLGEPMTYYKSKTIDYHYHRIEAYGFTYRESGEVLTLYKVNHPSGIVLEVGLSTAPGGYVWITPNWYIPTFFGSINLCREDPSQGTMVMTYFSDYVPYASRVERLMGFWGPEYWPFSSSDPCAEPEINWPLHGRDGFQGWKQVSLEDIFLFSGVHGDEIETWTADIAPAPSNVQIGFLIRPMLYPTYILFYPEIPSWQEGFPLEYFFGIPTNMFPFFSKSLEIDSF